MKIKITKIKDTVKRLFAVKRSTAIVTATALLVGGLTLCIATGCGGGGGNDPGGGTSHSSDVPRGTFDSSTVFDSGTGGGTESGTIAGTEADVTIGSEIETTDDLAVESDTGVVTEGNQTTGTFGPVVNTEDPAVTTPIPVTLGPITQAPQTQAPATQPPVTQAPVTQAPITQAPETRPPQTQAPETEPAETKPVFVHSADLKTGISWDGVSPIIFTYSDGTTGTEIKLGATYESTPGMYATVLDIDMPDYVYVPDPDEGKCRHCGKVMGNGTNGTCVRWSMTDIDCPKCGEHVEKKTCHTCKK